MADISAICPQCKQQQTVNSSEEVVFCRFCNRPFAVKDAIKLHTEYLERSEASKKPSDAAIAKFNAILAQDYKLAEKYLEDVINKEYSQESKKHLLFRYTSYSILGSVAFPNTLSMLSEKKYEIEKILNDIRSVNPCIAEMYYKILCARVNDMLQGIDKNHSFHGDLAFLKILLYDMKEKLSRIGTPFSTNYTELFSRVIQNWNNLTKDISQYKCWLSQEYDDEYIKYIIREIEWLPQLRIRYRTITSTFDDVTRDFTFDEALREKHYDVNNSIKMLEKLLSSPEAWEVEKKMQADKAREFANSQKKKETIRSFWSCYIDLLREKKVKKAYEYLKAANSADIYKMDEYKTEMTKFKKTMFKIEYAGEPPVLVHHLATDTYYLYYPKE